MGEHRQDIEERHKFGQSRQEAPKTGLSSPQQPKSSQIQGQGEAPLSLSEDWLGDDGSLCEADP